MSMIRTRFYTAEIGTPQRFFGSYAPMGQAIVAQGNALGLDGENAGALKGRPNS